MGRIQSSVGLVTGIPIKDTVDQLMAVAARPRDALAARKKALEAEQAAVTDLTALTLGVQIAVRRLKTVEVFQTRRVSSSDSSLLTATASTAVPAGQYQFVPAQLAQAHHTLSGGIAARNEALGAGELTFRFGGQVNQGVSLDDLNSGAGVSSGKIRLTDRAGGTAVIDLRFARTIDDVLQAINSSDDVEVDAAVVGDRIQLTDKSGGGGNLRVQEVSGGTTAAGLGLDGINAASNEALGQDIVQLFDALSIKKLNDGNGLSLRPALADLAFTFRDGTTLQVDLDPVGQPAPLTLGDIVDALNAADPAKLSAQISGDGERIVLTDLTTDTGGTFAASSPLGGTVARELGLAGAAAGGTLTGSRLLSGLKSTLLSSLNGGSGVGTLGDISITDRGGNAAIIDLSGAESLDDVIAEINAAGIGVRAEYNAARNGLRIVDTTGLTTSNLIVADGDATNSATDLGLAGSVAAQTIDSGTLQRQVVSRSTLLASYNGGKGVSLGSIRISDSAGLATTVNLAALEPTTIGDVIDAINGLSVGVEARINDAGDGLVLIDTAGGSGKLNVAEVGNGRSAADLHILGESTATTIDGSSKQAINGTTTFRIELDADDTLDDLVAKVNALGAGAQASVLSASSGSLRHHLSLLSTASGKAGELLVDGSGLSLTFQDVAEAQDAIVQFGSGGPLGGILLSSSTNEFQNIIEGLDITVVGESADPVSIGVSESADSAATAVQAFVDQFNKLRDKLGSYTFFNAEQLTKGTLFGSSLALRLDSDLSRLMTGRFTASESVRSMAELGVSVDDKGKLSFDKTKFVARFDGDSEAVSDFFTDETNGFVAQADKALEALVGLNNSLIINRVGTLQRQIEDSADRINTLTARLDRQREQMLLKFFRIEEVVSRLKNSLSALGEIQYIPPVNN